MEITVLSEALLWPPKGSISMQELSQDWHNEPLAPAAQFALLEDPTHLWLIAARQAPAKPHPTGDCGDFQDELWKHDVAELFIADPDFKNYLEFNLSPAGAWWTAAFSAPRVPMALKGLPTVLCNAGSEGAGGWVATLAVPLDWLRSTIDWSEDSALNVTFILDSPQQRFLSACDLGDGEPDFHRPQGFARAQVRKPKPQQGSEPLDFD